MAQRRVFLSAVSVEFRDVRERLSDALGGLDISHFEQSGFSDLGRGTLLDLLERVQASDVVPHLIGARTGATPPDGQVALLFQAVDGLEAMLGLDAAAAADISYTQWEALIAAKLGKRVLCFAPTATFERPEPQEDADLAAEAASQARHLERLARLDLHASPVGGYDGLALRLLLGPLKSDLAGARLRRLAPQVSENLPDVHVRRVVGRGPELAALRAAWDDPKVKIAAPWAIGGAGKTTLAKTFFERLRDDPTADLGAAFAYSFYRQGAVTDGDVSSDEFFQAAFAYFEAGTPPDGPEAAGAALAELVRGRRALLILDGLEPLQFSTGGSNQSRKHGGVKDANLKRFLLALRDAPVDEDRPFGLVLITTRIEISELAGDPSVRSDPLEPLSLLDGIALMRAQGVEPHGADGDAPGRPLPSRAQVRTALGGAEPPEGYDPPAAEGETVPPLIAADLATAVAELKGHALAVSLAAKYLADLEGGRIEKFPEMPSEPELYEALAGAHGWTDEDRKHRDPFKVMFALERAAIADIEAQGLTHAPETTGAGVELGLLFFLGFFEGPITAAMLAEVFPPGADAPLPADLQIGATPEVADRASAPERRARAGLWSTMRAFGQRIRPARRDPSAPPEDKAAPASQDAATVRDARRRVLLRRIVGAVADPERVSTATLAAAYGRLADRGLVNRDSGDRNWRDASIDCHPLVRSYFGLRLERLDPELFRAGHGRMYDHLRLRDIPVAWRDPVSYGLLCAEIAQPRAGAKGVAEALVAGAFPAEREYTLTPALVAADRDAVAAAAERIGWPDWDAALEAAFSGRKLTQAEITPAIRAALTAKLQPLFVALRHGVRAGRADAAFRETYKPRIRRGDADFASSTLGLFGPELAALSPFYQGGWGAPSGDLSKHDQALLLNLAGFRLRALGRLEEATAPFRAAPSARTALEDWANAGSDAENLAEHVLLIGRIRPARTAADEAAAHAERVSKQDRKLLRRMGAATRSLAAAQAAGDLAAAERAQRAAEDAQRERQPELPRLYSLGGFLTAELLAARGRWDEAAARVRWLRPLTEAQKGVGLDLGLVRLQASAVALAEAAGDVDGGDLLWAAPAEAADAALAALREAGATHHLPRGLLLAAEARWRAGREDFGPLLEECKGLVERGPMPLFEIRLWLLRGRIACGAGRYARAAKWADAVETQIGVVARKTMEDEIAETEATPRAPTPAEIDANRYRAAEPELAMLRAEIAAGRGDADADARLGAALAAIEAGWFGLLPRARALSAADDPRRVAAEAAKAAYDAERDAWIAETGGIPGPRAPGMTLDQALDMLEAMPEAERGPLRRAILDQVPPEALAQSPPERRRLLGLDGDG